MTLRAAISFFATLHLCACATVVQGKSDTVKLSSTPSGADVLFEGANGARASVTCTTPCEAELRRTATWNATVSLPGHTPYRYQLRPGIGGSGPAGMAGNIIAGGGIGVGVDALTGAIYRYPKTVLVTMRRAGEPNT